VRRKLTKTTLVDVAEDVKLIHFEILHVLKEEGKLHVAEIGERLQVAKAQMTHLINKLVELDLVERKVDAVDRRILNIDLTGKDKTLLEEHESAMLNAVRDNMSSLTEKELTTLSSSLRNLRDTLLKLQ
jgi:MarR family 2-MHQ and catechol resistance regulon transcriptional repressor